MSVFFSEHVSGASTFRPLAEPAKPPKVIAQIFANRVPEPIAELFAAAETLTPKSKITIERVDAALKDLDIEKRIAIKSELYRLGAIAA